MRDQIGWIVFLLYSAVIFAFGMWVEDQRSFDKEPAPNPPAPTTVQHQVEKGLYACTALTQEFRQLNQSVSRWSHGTR